MLPIFPKIPPKGEALGPGEVLVCAPPSGVRTACPDFDIPKGRACPAAQSWMAFHLTCPNLTLGLNNITATQLNTFSSSERHAVNSWRLGLPTANPTPLKSRADAQSCERPTKLKRQLSGRPYRVEKLGDFELEPVRIAQLATSPSRSGVHHGTRQNKAAA